ncbi:MAG TPA: hypothetical protein VM143_13480 [Acidimicrobiales bacterium]|nr:hypothetical protein [Acidimicrobiales bacterium]
MEHAFFVAPELVPDVLPTSGWWRRLPVVALAVLALSAFVGTIVDVTNGQGPTPTATTAAAAATTQVPAPTTAAEAAPAAVAAPTSGPGYRILSTDGGVSTHGWVRFEGSAAGESASPSVGIAHPDGSGSDGYWVASADGGVFAFGDAPFLGSAAGASAEPIVGLVSTPTGKGYWLVASDGGVFGFGDAAYLGSGPEIGLPAKVVSLARTGAGDGYWLVTSDGGVFAFGNAPFFGSLGDQQVNAKIVDLVPTPSGAGYYLVAADGGVFTFGDAVFHGAAIGEHLSRPIVDMALDPEGTGYWLLSGDGGVFSYGSAPFLGAPVTAGGRFKAIAAAIGHDQPPEPAPAVAADAVPTVSVAAAAHPVAADGQAPTAAVAPAASPGRGKVSARSAKAAKDAPLDGKFGWDISYPQCGGMLPGGDYSYAIVGVNGGRAFKHNKCLAEQWRWARDSGAAGIYVNVHFPRGQDELAKGATSDRQPDCAPGALACVAYNFGLNAIRDSLDYAKDQGVDAPFVWLDVEQLNYWYPEPTFNAVVLRGAVDAAAEAGIGVGVYSTPYQYNKITGGEQLGLPVWSAGADGLGSVDLYCRERGFGGGPAVLVQLLPGQFDPNLACPGSGPMSRYFRMR